jgi:hypothetical protein
MHIEAIWSEARPLLSKLAGFKYIERFYLVGGTALALQIGHRISVDLDWFSQEALPEDLLKQLQVFFSGFKIVTEVNNGSELTVMVNGVKITFLHYPFPLVERLLAGDGFNMASITDIAVMKAHTVGRRAAFRDYVDLYFILRDKMSLTEISQKAGQCFGDEFNQRLFLEQLVYLNDLTEEGVDFLKEKVSKKDLQRFFEDMVKRLEV